MKIGFCCKWIDSDKAKVALMNQKSTTQKHLRTLSNPEQFEKIFNLVEYNCITLWNQLKWLSIQPVEMRLFRITSDFLPLFTVKDFQWIYNSDSIKQLVEDQLRPIRQFADANNIRLCMHPGQYTNLCSTNPEIVKASILDFEYHVYLAKLMGYGDTWHSSGFAINIHANVRQDPGLKNIRNIIKNDLSVEASNLITLENDEYSCGIHDFLDNYVHEEVALVLDTHHHWIHSKGSWLIPGANGTQLFAESWRDIRPLGHFSMPNLDAIPDYVLAIMNASNSKPDYSKLTAIKGISSRDLRAHSYGMWCEPMLDFLVGFLNDWDIEIEAKGKNIASKQVYDHVMKRKAS
jgi:UV DNA damage endonuclease